jgi:hypothetical protein
VRSVTGVNRRKSRHRLPKIDRGIGSLSRFGLGCTGLMGRPGFAHTGHGFSGLLRVSPGIICFGSAGDDSAPPPEDWPEIASYPPKIGSASSRVSARGSAGSSLLSFPLSRESVINIYRLLY